MSTLTFALEMHLRALLQSCRKSCMLLTATRFTHLPSAAAEPHKKININTKQHENKHVVRQLANSCNRHKFSVARTV